MTDTTGKHLETEQKYDAAADFIMPELSGLGGRTKATGRHRYYLSATYYDTDELDLIKNRITLRRRVGGPDEGWHLKLPVRQDTRQEVRMPLSEGDHGTPPRTACPRRAPAAPPRTPARRWYEPRGSLRPNDMKPGVHSGCVQGPDRGDGAAGFVGSPEVVQSES